MLLSLRFLLSFSIVNPNIFNIKMRMALRRHISLNEHLSQSGTRSIRNNAVLARASMLLSRQRQWPAANIHSTHAFRAFLACLIFANLLLYRKQLESETHLCALRASPCVCAFYVISRSRAQLSRQSRVSSVLVALIHQGSVRIVQLSVSPGQSYRRHRDYCHCVATDQVTSPRHQNRPHGRLKNELQVGTEEEPEPKAIPWAEAVSAVLTNNGKRSKRK